MIDAYLPGARFCHSHPLSPQHTSRAEATKLPSSFRMGAASMESWPRSCFSSFSFFLLLILLFYSLCDVHRSQICFPLFASPDLYPIFVYLPLLCFLLNLSSLLP